MTESGLPLSIRTPFSALETKGWLRALPEVLASLASGSLGLYSLSVEGHRGISAVILAGAVGFGLAAAIRLSPINERYRLPPFALAIGVALAASLLAAQMANEPVPTFDIRVGPIFPWAAAVIVTVVAITRGLTAKSGQAGLGKPRPYVWRLLSAAFRNSSEIALVALITILAFVLRIVDLTGLPAPFSGDEAAFIMQAERVGEGEIHNVFHSGFQGHPNAFWYTLYGFTEVFGDSVWGSRIYGVVVGTVAVPLLYLLLRSLFSKNVALIGTLYAAAFHFAIQYSRQDMNNIADMASMSLVALFLWRALTNHKPYDYAAAGLTAGLAMYMYAGARALVPIIGLVFLIGLCLQPRKYREIVVGGVYLAAAMLIAAVPLGLFWLEHPDEFSNRINEIGIYQSGWMEAEVLKTGRGEISLLWQQARQAFGVFGYHADKSPFYRTQMPLVDNASVAFFLLGLAAAVVRLYQPRYFILLSTFLVVVVTGGILTVEPPQSQRFLGTVPAIAAFVAVGAVGVGEVVKRLWAGAPAGFVAAAVVAALAAFNVHYYFVTYDTSDQYSDFNTRIADRAGSYAAALPQETRVYWMGAPFIFLGHPSLLWQVQDRVRTGPMGSVFDVLDDGRIEPTPLGFTTEAAVLALDGRQKEFDEIVSRCPGGNVEKMVDEKDRNLFLTYESSDGECVANAMLMITYGR